MGSVRGEDGPQGLVLGGLHRVVAEVGDLSKELVKLSEPSRFKKTDQYRWRELFDVYVQAGIFFSDLEKDHGKRDSVAALKRLQ